MPRLSTNGLRWQCSGDFVARQCLQYRGVLPVCADPSLGSPDGAILRAALQEVRRRMEEPERQRGDTLFGRRAGALAQERAAQLSRLHVHAYTANAPPSYKVLTETRSFLCCLYQHCVLSTTAPLFLVLVLHLLLLLHRLSLLSLLLPAGQPPWTVGSRRSRGGESVPARQ